MSQIKYVFLVSTFLGAALLGFQNCSDVNFSDAPVNSLGEAPIGEHALNKLKPAIAVRGAGCINCHASINSNLVTDFGFRDPFYFKSAKDIRYANMYDGYYSDRWSGGASEGWGSISLSPGSKVIVPKDTTPFQINTASFQNLPDFLTQNLFKNGRNAGVTVSQAERFYIGAPTADRLRVVTGFSASGATKYKYIPQNPSVAFGAGITVGASGVVEISGNFACDGDLIVDETLFLDKVRVNTLEGCRIYATKSVFINGAIEYVGTSPKRNLQIVSAKAVLMGFNLATINSRMVSIFDVAGESVNFGLRGVSNARAYNESILAEAKPLGARLVDADAAAPVALTERLLLVAPQIQSRSKARMSGVIVAEVALFRLQVFNFQYDNVFDEVRILPLVPNTDYFDVEE